MLKTYAKSAAKNIIPLKIFGQKFTTYTEKLKVLAKKLGILDNFLSFHEGVSGARLRNEYRRSRVFLYGSHTECQPLVLLDAMAAGTPFISRASGCIDSMMGGVAVHDENEAAAQLNILLDDTSRWQLQSKAGLAGIRPHLKGEVGQTWASVLKHISAHTDPMRT